MKLKNTKIKNPEGEEYTRGDGKEKATLFSLIVDTISLVTPEDKHKNDPLRVYSIVNKIAQAKDDEVDLQAEDIVYIKDIFKNNSPFTPYLTGAIITLLEKE